MKISDTVVMFQKIFQNTKAAVRGSIKGPVRKFDLPYLMLKEKIQQLKTTLMGAKGIK